MSTLVVCEKPSVARSVAEVLGATKKCTGYTEGNGYAVSWCYGHLVGLMFPDDYGDKWSGKWDFSQLPMIPEEWKFRITDSGKDQYKILKKLMNDSDISEIICATDADREGECIFRYVYNLSGSRKPVKRLWISSLEETVIRKGFDALKPSAAYDSLYSAGFSRAQADWLVGMNASRLFSCRFGNSLSIGRVQTPTLALIVNRDRQISDFVKQKYFTVDLILPDFKASSERIDSEDTACKLASACNNSHAEVKEIRNENKKINPPKLYDLTTLQREANRILGYTASQTLEYLQALYEGKLATYPRTNSQYLPDDMKDTAVQVISSARNIFPELFVSDSFDIDKCINNSKVESHHAIIPTVNIAGANINGLPEGQRNILILLCGKLLCAAGEQHTFNSCSVTLMCEDTEFKASGKTVTSSGWKDTYSAMLSYLNIKSADADEEHTSSLPVLHEGDIFSDISAEKSEHFTSPPKSFTEETLLSAMEHAGQENYDENSEKKGLGTPATRAGIIESLVTRGYVVRDKKKLCSTDKGRQLIASVPDEIKSAAMTAEWENNLQKIENGSYSSDLFMNEITAFVRKLCSDYSSFENSSSLSHKEDSPGKCPVCSNDVVNGKYGFYCKGKCGMQIAKVYGHSLTESQIKSLLSGKSISLNISGSKSTINSEAESFCYTDKNGKEVKGFQWKTERNH